MSVVEWIIARGQLLAFFAGIIAPLAAIAAAIGAWGVTQQQARQREKYEGQIAALKETVAEKSDEVARLAKRNLDALIGGTSYCLAHTGPPDDPKGMVLTLKHSGEFPLYDLVAYVADQGEVKVRSSGEHAPATGPVEFENAPRYHVGTLAVKTGTTLPRLPPATGERRSVIIRFAARNGVWNQYLHVRRVDRSRWKVMIHAFRDDEPMKPLAMIEEYIPAFAGKIP